MAVGGFEVRGEAAEEGRREQQSLSSIARWLIRDLEECNLLVKFEYIHNAEKLVGRNWHDKFTDFKEGGGACALKGERVGGVVGYGVGGRERPSFDPSIIQMCCLFFIFFLSFFFFSLLCFFFYLPLRFHSNLTRSYDARFSRAVWHFL